jgi:hypothetical protein
MLSLYSFLWMMWIWSDLNAMEVHLWKFKEILGWNKVHPKKSSVILFNPWRLVVHSPFIAHSLFYNLWAGLKLIWAVSPLGEVDLAIWQCCLDDVEIGNGGLGNMDLTIGHTELMTWQVAMANQPTWSTWHKLPNSQIAMWTLQIGKVDSGNK